MKKGRIDSYPLDMKIIKKIIIVGMKETIVPAFNAGTPIVEKLYSQRYILQE